MSAHFDTEVMEQLDKLYREHLSELSAQPPCGAAARLSLGESAAFAIPGQNPVAMFRENLSALPSENESEEFASPLPSVSDEVAEDFPDGKILQPRKLSLRVF